MREERTSCPSGQASSICSRRIRLTAALAALSLRASGSLLDILPLLQASYSCRFRAHGCGGGDDRGDGGREEEDWVLVAGMDLP